MKLEPSDREAIEEIVEATVRKTLLDLNIDVTTPSKVIEFRETMSEVAEWRRAMREVKKAFTLASIGTVSAGLLAALWLGIQAMLGRGHG